MPPSKVKLVYLLQYFWYYIADTGYYSTVGRKLLILPDWQCIQLQIVVLLVSGMIVW